VTALKVLLAEDEPAVAASIEQQIRALGHEVIAEATTGSEAVRLAAQKRPDVIVMDIKMPDCDGIEAARQIAEQSPLPIVFLTGHFEEEFLAGAAASGGLAYLLKPATSEQLQAALTLAYTRFAEMRDLKQQVVRLEKALEVRKLVSQAKGLLMARHGLSEEEAHRRMQKEASRSNQKLVDLARAVLATEPLLATRNGAVSSPSETRPRVGGS
jgi:response regulator NasT